MKKGDSVLVKSVSGNWVNATFNHEYGGKFYVRLSCDNCLFEFDECKPAKQTVEEFNTKWTDIMMQSRCQLLASHEVLNQYYQDRKKWENE